MSSIESRRERQMTEIGSLRCPDHMPGSFVDKAETLLTSGWSKATWHSRENILRTVDWLLHMERAQRRGPAHVPAKWVPVRRQGHAPLNSSRARPNSGGTGRALEGSN